MYAAGCTEKSPAPPSTKTQAKGTKAAPAKTAGPDWEKGFTFDPRFDGSKAELVVDLRIADGFHVYTTGETIGRPLKLTLRDEGGFELDGEPSYPKGKEKKVLGQKSVIVEGKESIRAKLKPKMEAASTKIEAALAYQVCTNEACDRPRTKPFTVEVK